MTVRGVVAENTPLYDAGLDQGCEIISLDGQPVNSKDSWDAIVNGLEAGKTYGIGFEQLGQNKTGRFTASVSPEMKIRFEEGKRKAKKAREAWLWR
jgi:S1-C subfamily serine protease